MNILLLGHNGYLGSYLHKHLQCDIATGRYGRLTPSNNYDIVINCIAKTNIQWCEDNPDQSFNINASFNLDLYTLFPGSKIISFSTYYVYDTDKLATENHPLASNSLKYISHKILGEKYNHSGLVFRIGKLFGNPYKSQNRLTEYILSEPSLELDFHWFNPCSCKCILKVLQNTEFLMQSTGIFNLSNLGITTPVDYAEFILSKKGLQKRVKFVERKPFPNYGRFAMDVSKIQQHLELDHWETDMEEYLECIA